MMIDLRMQLDRVRNFLQTRPAKHIAWIAIVALTLAAPVSTAVAQTDNPKDAFERAMADVKKSTKGSMAEAQAMERAMVAARRLPAPPAVSDAVLDHQGRAEAATRAAKSPRDFLDAAEAFGEAARLAPWLPENHFNRGIVLEKAERYDAAERALQLYLKAAPDAKDTAEVRKRIAGLRYLNEKAAREKAAAETKSGPAPPAQVAPSGPSDAEKREAERLVASLAGRWNNSCAGPQTIPGNPYELMNAGALALDWRAWDYVDREWIEHGRVQGFFVYDMNAKKLVMNNRRVAGQRRELVITDRNTLQETFISGGGYTQNCTWKRLQ